MDGSESLPVSGRDHRALVARQQCIDGVSVMALQKVLVEVAARTFVLREILAPATAAELIRRLNIRFMPCDVM